MPPVAADGNNESRAAWLGSTQATDSGKPRTRFPNQALARPGKKKCFGGLASLIQWPFAANKRLHRQECAERRAGGVLVPFFLLNRFGRRAQRIKKMAK
jgi:hypothetical protein